MTLEELGGSPPARRGEVSLVLDDYRQIDRVRAQLAARGSSDRMRRLELARDRRPLQAGRGRIAIRERHHPAIVRCVASAQLAAVLSTPQFAVLAALAARCAWWA